MDPNPDVGSLEACQEDLPAGEDIVFPEFSASGTQGGTLPTPEEVRKRAEEDYGSPANSFRPRPARFPELDLIVKWGEDITIAEGQCLWFLGKRLQGRVPVPKIYGWKQDQGQIFLYMELVEGDTLEERWPDLGDDEKAMICEQLRDMIISWRCVKQLNSTTTLSQIGGQALRDIVFYDGGLYPAGPFTSITDFHKAFANLVFRNSSEYDDPRGEIEELAGLNDDMPVVFTHADLDQSNIIISKPSDAPVRIVSIIDWHQSGWYPEPWEWLKAQTVATTGSDWLQNYLQTILNPAGHKYFFAWEFVRMSII